MTATEAMANRMTNDFTDSAWKISLMIAGLCTAVGIVGVLLRQMAISTSLDCVLVVGAYYWWMGTFSYLSERRRAAERGISSPSRRDSNALSKRSGRAANVDGLLKSLF